MKVKLDDLQSILGKIVLHLKEQGVDSLEIEDDYYWNISGDRLYNPYQEPDELTVGQLSEDMDWLLKILSGENVPIGYALVWLSSILRYVGEKNVS